MHDVHGEIAKWLVALEMIADIDAAGNLRAIYRADRDSAPRLMIGSHLDTVPKAGAYDGVLGVVLAVAILQALNGRRLPYAIELIGFSDEEGVRFGVPFIGSRALVGRLDQNLLAMKDAHGISMHAAIEEFGLQPAELSHAVLQKQTVAYLEFHIEQGPVLEQLANPLAAVEAIAGQTRMEITFLGRAAHAGTTPMNLRADALAGAAEWIGAVEEFGKCSSGLVATVGSIRVSPGAANVIPGEVRLTVDIRHRHDELRAKAVNELVNQADQVARRRGLSLQHTALMNQQAVVMDQFLTDQIEKAMRSTGCPPHRMVSGAGHDAMILAEKIPAAMIFLRTPGGISHNPAETVMVEDVARAIDCGVHLLDQLASEPEFLTRTRRA